VFFSSISVPAVVSFGLAGNVSVRSVGNGNPDGSCSIGLVSLWASGSWVRAHLAVNQGELRSNDPREIVGGVLSSAIRVPAVVSNGLSGNVSLRSVSNGSPESSSSIGLVSAGNCVWWNKSRIADNLVSGAVKPGEAVCGVFFSSISVPAVVSFGLAGNVSVGSVGNGNPDCSSSIGLVSLRSTCGGVRAHLAVNQGELRSNDPREIVGGVLSSAIRVPATVSNGLGWNVSVGSVGNYTPECASSVSLVTASNSARRRTTSVADKLVSIDNDPGEVASSVFFSAIWEPRLVSGRLSRDVSPL